MLSKPTWLLGKMVLAGMLAILNRSGREVGVGSVSGEAGMRTRFVYSKKDWQLMQERRAGELHEGVEVGDGSELGVGGLDCVGQVLGGTFRAHLVCSCHHQQ